MPRDHRQTRTALIEAAADMRLLLERGYPRGRVLALAGDRWRLDAADRAMLNRGVHAPAQAAARAAKLLSLGQVQGRAVAVDGHNVLITLETALAGGRLVLADDQVVRDISEVGRHHKPGPATLRAAEMMLTALHKAGAASVAMYLDAPLPKSGELAGELRGLMQHLGLDGEARAVAVPEQCLYQHQGPAASSDSVVIDQVAEPLDLAGHIIRARGQGSSLEKLV